MLTVYFMLIFSATRTLGNPLRQVHDKDDNSLQKGVLSELLKNNENEANYKSKRPKREEETKVHQSTTSDDSFSHIPDNLFFLDEPTIFFNEPKKTTKKDLGRVDIQSQHNTQFYNTEESPDDLLEKCQKLLQTEHLRFQWEPKMNRPLPANKYPRSEDRDLLLSLCRAHVDLSSHHNLVEKLLHASNAAHSRDNGAVSQYGKEYGHIGGNPGHASNSWGDLLSLQNLDHMGTHLGNLGVNGQGGLEGNAGVYGEGGTAENVGLGGHGGLAGNFGAGGKGGLVGNLGIGGNGGFIGNVGIGGDPDQYFDYFTGSGAENLLGKFFSELNYHAPTGSTEDIAKFSLQYPPVNQGFGQNGNDFQSGNSISFSQNELGSASIAGQSGVAGSLAAKGSGEQYGSMGLLGKGDLSVNVAFRGTGSANDYVSSASQGEHLGNMLVGAGRGFTENLVLSADALPNFSAKASESSSQKVARNDDGLDQDRTIRCHVGALAHGGKGAYIGNLAINSGRSVHPRACCHSGCVHTYMILRVLNSKEDDSAVKGLAVTGEEDGVNSRPASSPKLQLAKFRPIGVNTGRRDWVTVYGNENDRKPWIPL